MEILIWVRNWPAIVVLIISRGKELIHKISLPNEFPSLHNNSLVIKEGSFGPSMITSNTMRLKRKATMAKKQDNYYRAEQMPSKFF